jgi:hypothetical protein
MTRPAAPSLYLLGFVAACVCFIVFKTPENAEKSHELARTVSQRLLDDYERHAGVTSKGEFVGIGTSHPDTALHVARRHPDILKLENLSKGGTQWLLQVGGNDWQNGNLMISHRPSGKYALVVEPNGNILVMGDMRVHGKLTTSQPMTAAPPSYAELQQRVDGLTTIVEKLLAKVGDLDPEDSPLTTP